MKYRKYTYIEVLDNMTKSRKHYKHNIILNLIAKLGLDSMIYKIVKTCWWSSSNLSFTDADQIYTAGSKSNTIFEAWTGLILFGKVLSYDKLAMNRQRCWVAYLDLIYFNKYSHFKYFIESKDAIGASWKNTSKANPINYLLEEY